MKRIEVELRLRVPSRRREPPPSYEQALFMSDTPAAEDTSNPGLEGRREVRDDDTDSYCDSFESEEGEDRGQRDDDSDGTHDGILVLTDVVPEEVGSESSSMLDMLEHEIEIAHADVGPADDVEFVEEDEESHQLHLLDIGNSTEQKLPRIKSIKRYREPRNRQTLSYYDQHTYTAISRLRAVNKRLTHQLEQQNKLVAKLNEEKKQHLHQINSLRADLQLHKQTLRSVQANTSKGAAAGSNNHQHETLPTVSRQPQSTTNSRDEKDSNARCVTPRSPASPSRRPPLSPSTPSPRTSPRVKTPVATGKCCGNCGRSNAQDSHIVDMYQAKLEKAEEERKEMQSRHAHQLANYSHELSRLERLLEKTHAVVQEKDNELRLQRTRQLYCSTPTSPNNNGVALLRKNSNGPNSTYPQNATAGRRESLQVKNIFSDDIWKGLLPLPVSKPANNTTDTSNVPPNEAVAADSLSATPVSFTSHVGQAFEQLLSHQLVSLHDTTLDRSTREWLQEVRHCGSQMLVLQHSFQVLAHSLQRLAECTHLYQLAEILTDECRDLLQAEQALVLVVDKSEQEFWCRLPSRLASENTARIQTTDTSKPQMGTVRSTLLPLTNSGSQVDSVSVTAPCGMASLAYHTKRPLLLAAGQMPRHSKYSVATDNADRLVTHPNSSTLLVPIIHQNRVVAVVQVCGKLTQVEALGLSIALEKSAAFTSEDQALLTLVCHFSSGLFPKVAYFTDVESNKVNEETFIQLAPEIFTCLHFDELGKVVIQNAKNILDADRCSLFVADNASRTLHNWHSDISGTGVEVYQRSAQKATGMTIHFGQGIVGLVAETQQTINIPEAYDDPRFNSAWDQKTHYRTKSMLTVPIVSNMGNIETPKVSGSSSKADGDADDKRKADKQHLLGVVQVINKSGGAPFRAKDEFLLQTISKLIALAIENSQLFQRNQELCWNVGKLIAEGDMVEATVSLGTAAEQIIGVEGAAVYVLDPDTREFVTFHHKRRYRIALGESIYSGSLMGEAVQTQQLLIANDVSKSASFNAFVDSISGIPARSVLFAPLLVDDSDSILPGLCKLPNGLPTDNGQKLVGMLQLVNTKGRKTHFDQHDLFLSIVQSQSCSVLAAILEKQRMLRQKEQIALLLDASMSFFKEMSVVGVINAVYNACVGIFDTDTTAHLFLWEDNGRPVDKDRDRLMWTSKISPNAAASLASRSTSQDSTSNIQQITSEARGATSMNFIPSLSAQSRKVSVVTDQTLRAPTSEGLFQHVLMRGSAVIVKHWLCDDIEEAVDKGTPAGAQDVGKQRKSANGSASRQRSRARADKYTLNATHSDAQLGFTKHAVVACPVWSSYGQEIVGVLVLLFPRDHAAVAGGGHSDQLSTLPILTRQISGALGVCQDLITVSTRARRMQRTLELSRQPPRATVSLTLTSRGHLGAFSQPINVCSRVFSGRALSGELHPISAANLTVHSLYMDEYGDRWCFQLTGVPANEMSCDHYAQWIGKNVDLPAGYKETEVFAKLRTDLQYVYTHKEVITGVIDARPHQMELNDGNSLDDSEDDSQVDALPRVVLLKLRQLLWNFTDAAWQVDLGRASHALFGAFVRQDGHKGKKMLSRHEIEQALGNEPGGAGISMSVAEWDQLHASFAHEEHRLVDVDAMLVALCPHIKTFPLITYELAPMLDTITHAVVSVHILFLS